MNATVAAECQRLLAKLETEGEEVWQAYETGKITRQDYETYVETGEPPAKLKARLSGST